MADSKHVKFSLKVMVNKQKTKVLFAEVDSDFADVLLSFLTLPLGTIIRVLKKHYGDDLETPVNIGSLTSLYNGLSNLNNVCFWTDGCKEMLLKPRSSFKAECRRLKLDISETRPANYYFACEKYSGCGYSNIRIYDDTARCGYCGKTMKREVNIKDSQDDDSTADGVFTISSVSFLIADDLWMLPNVAVSVMQTLRNLGVTDTDGAELMNVTFGFNEIMDLLKGSLLSRTPLTDIILKKENTAEESSGPGILLHRRIMKEAVCSSNKKMNLKLMLHESTNKLLFAQAGNDFVDFLFSLLTIPLGGVLDCILGTNTNSVKSIDNLYKSVADLIDEKYLSTPDTKTRLLKPKVPHGCMSENPILPLEEEIARHLCYNRDVKLGVEWLSYSNTRDTIEVVYPKGQRDYVKGPTMYMVSDDLTVKPLCMISSLSVLKEMKIPSSDVKEVEVQIGLQEALSILRASLTSTSALTDGLMISPV